MSQSFLSFISKDLGCPRPSKIHNFSGPIASSFRLHNILHFMRNLDSARKMHKNSSFNIRSTW